MPHAIISIPDSKRDDMTRILLEECDAQTLREIIEDMDSVEWQRLFRCLTGAPSAQGVLTQKQWSLLDAAQRGGEMLDGTTSRRVGGSR